MASQQVNHPLAAGFQLDDYRIDQQLSLGGFSIVYLAHDASGTPVAIKEYLPNSLALRAEGQVVPVISSENLGAFRHGMKCFFEEGRALARINHPNIVRVLNFFRANETVYMVMQYERGRTLQEHIRKHRGALKEEFLRTVFNRLLNGLGEIHLRRLLHLDIKPSNIYLRNDGTPVLLDFGAVRQTLISDQPLLKPMYTPGFAAPEQYGHQRQFLGPWTDLYAIGASMYASLAGTAPLAADLREDEDDLPPAAERWRGRYSSHLLGIVDWCLQLDHARRPQSVAALQQALGARPESKAAQGWLQAVRGKLQGLMAR